MLFFSPLFFCLLQLTIFNLLLSTVDLQSQLHMAVAREHAALEKEHVLQSKQTGLETQLSSIKQAKAQLLATLEMEKAKAEAVQEELER